MSMYVGLLFWGEVKDVITNYIYDYIILPSDFLKISVERKYKFLNLAFKIFCIMSSISHNWRVSGKSF